MRKGKGQLTYKQEKDYLKKELALARAEAKKYATQNEELKKQIEALRKTIADKDVAINELISENYQLESILREATPEELDTLVERAEKSLQDRYDKFWATHPELRTEKE